MFNLSFQELFLRLIPEGFFYILAAYAFSKTQVNVRKYITSSILFAVIMFVIRFLPIQYGVHTILGIIGLIILNVNVNKIDIIKSVQSSIIVIIFEFLCEAVNLFIVQYIFKVDANYVFNNPNDRLLYGIPSLLIFGISIIIYYFRFSNKKDLRKF